MRIKDLFCLSFRVLLFLVSLRPLLSPAEDLHEKTSSAASPSVSLPPTPTATAPPESKDSKPETTKAQVGLPTVTTKVCSPKDLHRKDCAFRLPPYALQISKLKITWKDGMWTSITDVPMTDDGFEWSKVQLSRFPGPRWLVEMWIWDAGQGEAKVQSLHWYVIEIKGREAKQLVHEIVRKRAVRATTPNSYTYDLMRAHGLRAHGKLKLQWHVDGQWKSL